MLHLYYHVSHRYLWLHQNLTAKVRKVVLLTPHVPVVLPLLAGALLVPVVAVGVGVHLPVRHPRAHFPLALRSLHSQGPDVAGESDMEFRGRVESTSRLISPLESGHRQGQGCAGVHACT